MLNRLTEKFRRIAKNFADFTRAVHQKLSHCNSPQGSLQKCIDRQNVQE